MLDIMRERLTIAGITMSEEEFQQYIETSDDLGQGEKEATIPAGYKRCGHCGRVLKFILFNKNNAAKNKCTGSCKECQKETAKKSYSKTKKNRNYKKYYAENKEIKQTAARVYYNKNKDSILERQKSYHGSAKGRRVMRKSHKKRNKALKANQGIPYTRAIVIDRDSAHIGLNLPMCYLCGQPITDISGAGLHLDHIEPVVMGGKDCFSNVACTHTECNLRREKDARTLTVEQVESIIERTESYIDAHPEIFDNAE